MQKKIITIKSIVFVLLINIFQNLSLYCTAAQFLEAMEEKAISTLEELASKTAQQIPKELESTFQASEKEIVTAITSETGKSPQAIESALSSTFQAAEAADKAWFDAGLQPEELNKLVILKNLKTTNFTRYNEEADKLGKQLNDRATAQGKKAIYNRTMIDKLLAPVITEEDLIPTIESKLNTKFSETLIQRIKNIFSKIKSSIENFFGWAEEETQGAPAIEVVETKAPTAIEETIVRTTQQEAAAIQNTLMKTNSFKAGGWQGFKNDLNNLAQKNPGAYQTLMQNYMREVEELTGVSVTQSQIESALTDISGYKPPRIVATLPALSTSTPTKLPDFAISLDVPVEEFETEIEEEVVKPVAPTKPRRPGIGLPSTSTSTLK